ncbi:MULTISPECIES: hypothetical protein [Aphanizomenonaceae]|uniref:Peptidase A2 domain-containing protein n=1 Tax=Dolichospermum heterosporum TAC447 TaxID=747523 RepID=A0ABY5M2P8_9CYAN|nr:MULTISPECIES: hypothetical protein [Aphanizomenonaceae]UUO17479.1 hypothetical protein NG743_11090 [Dolichospermum heterosporum TAC447]
MIKFYAFKYSTSHPSQNEFDSLPRVLLVLRRGDQIVEAIGLVDSGATINVLPYEIGLQLGGVWDESKAIIQLAGNISQAAMPFFANAEIGEFPSVRLAFAWVSKPNAPLILGQTNFFMEFDVSFYRSQLEFEIKPKS